MVLGFTYEHFLQLTWRFEHGLALVALEDVNYRQTRKRVRSKCSLEHNRNTTNNILSNRKNHKNTTQ